MARADSYTAYVLNNLGTTLKEGETHTGYTVVVVRIPMMFRCKNRES